MRVAIVIENTVAATAIVDPDRIDLQKLERLCKVIDGTQHENADFG